jgi:predicted TIM-barrel fold metal-dependent hydrolase
MTAVTSRIGADIRAKLDHPVIDGDGHVQEAEFAMPDFLKKAAGADVVKKWEQFQKAEKTRPVRVTRWNQPSGKSSIDRAMAMLPRLRKERNQDAGIDFAIVYTTRGLGVISLPDDELRQAGCRALNMMNADMFHEVRDSMTPSALIPMHTPAEALAELEFAVKTLGFKTVTVAGEVHEPDPVVAREAPHLASRAQRIRSLTMDSPYDYDPVWAKCLELGVSVACHTGARERGGRRGSPTNFVFNHIGTFANGSEFFCRSLYMGGVTRRFPKLRFGLLEGGAAWGCELYNALVEHWEKRNLAAMKENLDPAKLDMDLMVRMFEKYGNEYLTPERMKGYRSTPNARIDEDPDTLDDFKALRIERPEDLRDLFVDSFYFGCEADDRMTAVAFNPKLNHFDAKIKAIFGSDIGHWDVVDALGVLGEAYALVEEQLMSTDDFREFVFANNVTLHTDMNPHFYRGTVIEKDVERLLGSR